MEQYSQRKYQPVTDSAHQQAELAIRQWQQQHQHAWRQLASLAWPEALVQYACTYQWAETLLQQSPCKPCAIKAYVRTLVEYGLVLCKSGQAQQLPGLRTLSGHSLEALLGQARARQLLKPLADIHRATPAQVDHWIGQLLLSEAPASVALRH